MNMSRIYLIMLIVFGGIAQNSYACGSYQTCNMIQIQDVRISPSPATAGEPVSIEFDSFEFANWLTSVPTMFYTPQTIVWIKDGIHEDIPLFPEKIYSEIYPDPPGTYGIPPYYTFSTQNGEFTHKAVWDGRDNAGNPVSGEQIIFIEIYAGSGKDIAHYTLTVTDTVTEYGDDKNLGKPPCGGVGDPCNPANGNVYNSELDYQSGDGLLTFERSYNSQLAQSSGLGKGWTSNLHRRLELDGEKMTVRNQDGSGESWQLNDDQLWSGDGDREFWLERSGDNYLLIRKDGTSEQYNSSGHLIAEKRSDGQQLYYSYNQADQLVEVSDSYGHKLHFSYDSSGNLQQLTDPADGIYIYQYTLTPADETLLSSVTYPDGSIRSYIYDDSGQPDLLSGIVNENGIRYVSYSYDEKGRVIETHFPDIGNAQPQEQYLFSYGEENVTVTNGLNEYQVYTFSENLGRKNIISRTQADGKGLTNSYDDNNRLIQHTDAEGRITHYGYNSYGQLTTIIKGYNTAEAQTTQFSYLSPEVDKPTSIVTTSQTAGEIQRTQLSYQDTAPDSRPLQISHSGYHSDGTPYQQTIHYSYDSQGRLKQIDGPREDVADITQFSYYNCSTGFECGQLATMTNALGQTHRYLEYDAHGRLLQEQDSNGLITEYQYDSRGRVLIVTQRGDGVSDRIRKMSYYETGQLRSITDAEGNLAQWQYDSNGNVTIATDALEQQIHYRYDLMGRKVSEEHYNSLQTLERQLGFSYNQRNQLLQFDNGGRVTQYDYLATGELTTRTDANGSRTQSKYDTLGRLARQIDPLSGISRFNYDPAGHPAQITTPNGATTDYTNTSSGAVEQRLSTDSGKTVNHYNSADQLIAQTDGRGISTNYSYDALGRLIFVDYPGEGEDQTYHYDNCSNGVGRLCRIKMRGNSILYSYTRFGEIAVQKQRIGKRRYITRYHYNAKGDISQIDYPDGRSISYQRNGNGQIIAVESEFEGNITPLLQSASYNSQGQLTGQQLGNGLEEQRSYNLTGELAAVIRQEDEWSYSYDSAGQLIEQTQSDGSRQSYSYDPLNRLTSWQQGDSAITYQYDANGNRTQQLTDDRNDSYQLLADSNQLIGINDEPVSRDEGGNTLDRGEMSYKYNAQGRLSAIYNRKGLRVAGYRYNALGQRIVKQTAKRIYHYHYNLDGQLIMVSQDNGTNVYSIIWSGQQPIAQINRTVGKGNGKAKGIRAGKARPKAKKNAVSYEMLWLHTDHLATPRYATDADGVTVWQWLSDPFGSTPADEDPDGDGRMVTVNLRFPGQYFDQETGLHYNWHRYYDPATGRYLTPDPIGVRGGGNLYAYVSNDPVNFVDPKGLAPDLELHHVISEIGKGAMKKTVRDTYASLNGRRIATLKDGVWYDNQNNSLSYNSFRDIYGDYAEQELRDQCIDMGLSGISVLAATAGIFASGGTSIALWGVGAAADTASALRSDSALEGALQLAPSVIGNPLTKTTGAVLGATGSAVNFGRGL